MAKLKNLTKTMVKLGKYPISLVRFVTILTLLLGLACKSSFHVTEVKTEELVITNALSESKTISNFLSPFKTKLDQSLDSVLAYNPKTLDKSVGKWQTEIGYWLAESSFEFCNSDFQLANQRQIDVVLYNQGGIRSILPQGDVTIRTAFALMPFENSCVVETLSGSEIIEMCLYIITEQKPHPLYGLSFEINDNSLPINIKIGNKPVEKSENYLVLTTDYLANGGDKMEFFKKSQKRYDLQVKLRDVIIGTFRKTDTIQVTMPKLITDKRL